MIYVKPVPVLLPANKWFGTMWPDCCNSISAETETAYLVCPFEKYDPTLIAVDPETTEYRKYLIKLFVGENGLYATPYFTESAFGTWRPGGAYVLLPVGPCWGYGCGYRLNIGNTAVPLYDFWMYATEPKEELWGFLREDDCWVTKIDESKYGFSSKEV